MAKDMAPEGRRPVQFGQATGPGPGGGADDGVMAPERPRGPLKPRQPACEDRRIEPGGELHRAAEDRLRAHHDGKRLKQAKARLRLHPPDHLKDRLRVHQAVGVKDQGKVIGPAAAAEEIRDIARLAPGILAAAAVEEPPLAAGFGHQAIEPIGFARDHLGPGTVGQDRKVDPRRGVVQRLHHRRHTGEGCGGVLIADRHQDRGLAPDRLCRRRCPPRRPKPDQRQPRAPGEPGGRQRQKDRAEIGIDGQSGG